MHVPLRPPDEHLLRFDDGYEAFARFWPAARPSAPLVLYLHGIQSHGGWYAWSASLLAECGAAVLLPDRRGSGRNQHARGDVLSAERWLADLNDCLAWARDRGCAGAVAVVGISWGGKLAAAWIAGGAPVDAALLVAPGIYPAVSVGVAGMLQIGASAALRPTKAFPIPLDDPALFTDDPDGRAFVTADELKLTAATARFLFQSACLDRRVRNLTQGSIAAKSSLVLAEHDRIIDNRRTEAWFRRACPEGEITWFEGAPHSIELAGDFHRQAFAAHLKNWVRVRLGIAAEKEIVQ